MRTVLQLHKRIVYIANRIEVEKGPGINYRWIYPNKNFPH